MIDRALILRPEPGNTRTADRLRQVGLTVVQLPLFAVRPMTWQLPDLSRYDALLLTSANGVVHGGVDLADLRCLPVVAVGAVTAAAARAAGFHVALVGTADAAGIQASATAAGLVRLLHLAGRDRVVLPGVDSITVYASDPLPISPGSLAALDRPTALIHSARAARRLAALATDDGVDRQGWTLGAISPAVAAAAGLGWGRVLVAPAPTDRDLIAALSVH